MTSREMMAYGLLIAAAVAIIAAVAWHFLSPARRRQRGRIRDENLYYGELRHGLREGLREGESPNP